MEIIKISDKKVSWEDDAERLILYADIMGFSHRVTFSNHKDLKLDLLKFKTFSRLFPLMFISSKHT